MALKAWVFFALIIALFRSSSSVQSYPRIVKVHFDLDDVLFIDDRAERFAMKFKMLSEWAESVNESSEIGREFDPELFLDTEEHTDTLRSFTQTTADGHVQQLRLVTSTFSCRMNFFWLPVDVQTCIITIRSRLYDKHVLVLNWIDSINLKPAASSANANFTVRRIEQSPDEDCLQSADSTDFSCLRLSIVCFRNYKQHLCSYMLPTAVFAFVAWSTLFVRSSNLRGMMTTLSMFATGALAYTTYLKLPCFDCVKFLDIWTLLVCGSVTLCFLEFIVVQLAFKREVSGRKKYTMNDLKPNCVDSFFRILLGVLLSFSIVFYLTYTYVAVNGRGNIF